MPDDFLHRHKEFQDLIRIVGEDRAIDPVLVEKDYWIMHCLYGLQQMGLSFELKGGTSLSKGLGIIDRFSEDIDIRIEPPAGQEVAVSPNQQKPQHVKSRRDFYDWLAGARRTMRRTREDVFAAATIPCLRRTKPSFRAIRRCVKAMPAPSIVRGRCSTGRSRTLTR